MAIFLITLSRSGILRDKTMDDEFIYIPNDDKQNYPSCRLKLIVEQFGHY